MMTGLYIYNLILEYISCHLGEINSPKLESGGIYKESSMNSVFCGQFQLVLFLT